MAELWREELSTCTRQEIVELQDRNRVWKKELRVRTAALVNSRLAKLILLEDYAAGRMACNQEIEESARRGRLLLDEIATRTGSEPGGHGTRSLKKQT